MPWEWPKKWQKKTKKKKIEWMSNEVPLYSTGNYVQSLGIDHDGRQYKKYVCVCVCERERETERETERDWVTLLYIRNR